MSSAEILRELAVFRAAMDAVISNVAGGVTTVDEVFRRRDSEPAISYLYAVKVLEADQRVGKVRARRLIAELGGRETTKISDLTPVQVDDILQRMKQVESWD